MCIPFLAITKECRIQRASQWYGEACEDQIAGGLLLGDQQKALCSKVTPTSNATEGSYESERDFS